MDFHSINKQCDQDASLIDMTLKLFVKNLNDNFQRSSENQLMFISRSNIVNS